MVVENAGDVLGSRIKTNLEGLRKKHGGTVTYAWTVAGLLKMLQFRRHLRPDAQMSAALADALRLCLDDESEWLAKLLEDNVLLASYSTQKQKEVEKCCQNPKTKKKSSEI